MVSFFVKQAALNLARDLNLNVPDADHPRGMGEAYRARPASKVHIAERDTQRTKSPKPLDAFDTWSVEGFVREGCSWPNSAGAPTRNGRPRMRTPLCGPERGRST